MKRALYCLPPTARRIASVLALPAVLAIAPEQARAILNVNIFDDGPDLKITVTGSIAGPLSPFDAGPCGRTGALAGQFNPPSNPISSRRSLICSGPDNTVNRYDLTGPAGFGGNSLLANGTTVSGFAFHLLPSSYNGLVRPSSFGLDTAYVLGQPFSSTAIFAGTSLASQGFTATGLIGTWTIVGTSESINVFIGPPAAASAPGPLPLFGAAAAFGWSRRLRQRIAAPLSTPPQV